MFCWLIFCWLAFSLRTRARRKECGRYYWEWDSPGSSEVSVDSLLGVSASASDSVSSVSEDHASPGAAAGTAARSMARAGADASGRNRSSRTGRCLDRRRSGFQSLQSFAQDVREQINNDLRAAAVRIFCGIVCADLDGGEMLLLREDLERLAHLRKRQSAFARIVRSLKALDDIHIEMQNELVAIPVNSFDGDLRGSRST